MHFENKGDCVFDDVAMFFVVDVVSILEVLVRATATGLALAVARNLSYQPVDS